MNYSRGTVKYIQTEHFASLIHEIMHNAPVIYEEIILF